MAVAWIALLPPVNVTAPENKPSLPAVSVEPVAWLLISSWTVLFGWALPDTVTLVARVTRPLAGWLNTGAGGGTWATLMVKLVVETLPSESRACSVSL